LLITDAGRRYVFRLLYISGVILTVGRGLIGLIFWSMVVVVVVGKHNLFDVVGKSSVCRAEECVCLPGERKKKGLLFANRGIIVLGLHRILWLQ